MTATQKTRVRDLRVGAWIDLYGRRQVVDVHNRPGGMLLLVTNRGEFDMPRDAEVTLC